MIKTLTILLLCAISLHLYADTIRGKVVKVYDGDTIGKKSRAFLAGAVASEVVTVEYSKRDRYKRLVGKVLLDGQDMNLRQVNAGLAWHYKKYQREQSARDRELYADAEIEARQARRGLWQESDPMPPWEWRKMKREKT